MNLYQERQRRGVTAAALGAAMGIKRETVGEIERGLVEVSEAYAAEMVEAMDRVMIEMGTHSA